MALENAAFRALFDVIGAFSATVNPSSLIDAAGETQTVSAQGAAVGDLVLVIPPYDLQDITVTAYVDSANSVQIRLQNEGGATVDLASGTWKYVVLRPTW